MMLHDAEFADVPSHVLLNAHPEPRQPGGSGGHDITGRLRVSGGVHFQGHIEKGDRREPKSTPKKYAAAVHDLAAYVDQ
jgi:hypothetical protein